MDVAAFAEIDVEKLPLTWVRTVTPRQDWAAPSSVMDTGMSCTVALATETGTAGVFWVLWGFLPKIAQAASTMANTPRATNPHRDRLAAAIHSFPCPPRVDAAEIGRGRGLRQCAKSLERQPDDGMRAASSRFVSP